MSNDNFNQTQKRISALWDKAERMILLFFETHNADATAPDSLPKMTDFNVIISAIKRLHEARLDLLKEAPRHEPHAGTRNLDSESPAQNISRIIEALEKNGNEASDNDALPD